MQSFDRILKDTKSKNHQGMVILIDIDHFKDINDTLGHDMGDHYLIEIGQRLRQNTREQDVVARLGGDEFAILISDVINYDCASAIIESLMQRIKQPLWISGKIFYPEMSIGATLFPKDGVDAVELMKNADIAMYTTKKNGRNGITMFDIKQKKSLDRRTFVSQRLREAIEKEDIDVAFQGQINLHNNNHIGFEALARWRDSGQYISPSEFVPIGEEFGLGHELDLQILRKSLSRVRRLKDNGYNPGSVAVNIGTLLLRDDKLPFTISNMLSEFGLLPKDLEIEVTERVMLERGHEKICNNLEVLRELGVAIALDDFGTGYASLTHLKNFSIDKIKIDRSFIRDIVHDKNDEAIVHAIINLAQSFNVKVVAEGIENDIQKQFLIDQKCYSGQGYLFHRPTVNLHDIEEYLDGHNGFVGSKKLLAAY